MNLKGAIEVSVILDKLRNSYLFEPGLYQFEFCCFTNDNGKINQAQPMCIESLNPFTTRKSMHNIKQGSVNEQEGTIKSKIFAIRLSEEKVKLNEVLTFYIDVDLKPEGPSSLFIQVQLLYCKITKKLIKSNKSEALFGVDSLKTIEVKNPIEGALSYFPLQFNSKSCLTVDGLISVCFYDYVFGSEDYKELAALFFPDKHEIIKKWIGGQEIDRKYSDIVSRILRCRDKLVNYFEDIMISCNLPVVEKIQSIELPICSIEKFPKTTFADILQDHDPISVSRQIVSEAKLIASIVYETFEKIKYELSNNMSTIVKYTKNIYKTKIYQKCKEFIINIDTKNTCHLIDSSIEISDRLEKIRVMREGQYLINLENLDLQESNFFCNYSDMPLIFEENFKPLKPSKFSPKYDFHMVVLVHGFQGNSFDMNQIKSILAQAYPKLMILDSAFNENQTEGDINEMGERLAEEILSFLALNFAERKPLISFIAHSLGGLIVRSALPLLEFFSSSFHAFITLSTPHLGLLYSGKLLETGIWLMKRVKYFQCLNQMGLKDTDDFLESFIYKLSSANGLQWFSHTVLVSSVQDEYAPISSARIEMNQKAKTDLKNGKNYVQMIKNILDKIVVTNVIKLDVHFKLTASIDTMIGRSAHLQLLENENFLKIFTNSHPELFI